MNNFRQFRAIFKFQAALKPFIIFMPLALAAPYYIPYIVRSSGHVYLEILLSNQNSFFVGWIGFMLLDPDGAQAGATVALGSSGSEFLLTRAVDRRLVLRARSAFFYLLILAIPLIALLVALRSPGIQVFEYDKIAHQRILDHIPGSIPAPRDAGGLLENITIPNGNILVDAWRICLFLSIGICTQAFVLLVYPLKFRWFILWGTFMGFILLPMFTMGRHSNRESLSSNESMFFTFVAHQWLCWFTVIAALLLTQLWCERRFARLEH